MGKYLPHQWPVNVAVDDGEKLAATGAMARVGGLETRTGECLVDVTRNRAGFIDLKLVLNQGRHALEGVKRQIALRDIGSKGIDLDPPVARSLFFERKTRNPAVNTVLVTVQFHIHCTLRSQLGNIRLTLEPRRLCLYTSNLARLAIADGAPSGSARN
jgi:hypothetical protein